MKCPRSKVNEKRKHGGIKRRYGRPYLGLTGRPPFQVELLRGPYLSDNSSWMKRHPRSDSGWYRNCSCGDSGWCLSCCHDDFCPTVAVTTKTTLSDVSGWCWCCFHPDLHRKGDEKMKNALHDVSGWNRSCYLVFPCSNSDEKEV